jgi:glycosyltransferase involved in cell wall biosynthesis
LRIGIEGQRLWRNKKHGMDFVALELVRKLQLIDRKNEYFIFVKSGRDPCLKASSNFNLIELPKVVYPYWEQVILPRAVKKYKIDLLHCTGNTAPLLPKAPFLVTIHDIIYLENNPLLSKGGTPYQRFGNLYRSWVVPRIMKKSVAITTVSEFEKNTILNLFPDLDRKLHTIYNAAAEHFKPVTDQGELERVRKAYMLPDKYLFYQGNTDPKKNARNVLIAYGKYMHETNNPLKLVLIDLNRLHLVRLLADIGIPSLIDSIHLTGYVINTDLPALYSMSELFLYPSVRESFGLPLLEAMQCGTPVITSDTSSMPEIAGNAALFCDPLDPRQLKDCIHNVLSDPLMKQKLIKNGFERSAFFSWDRAAKEMMELYNKIEA